MYRIYTEVDYADTCRDPSDIHVTELGHRLKEEDAVKLANQYIKKHFLTKDTKLRKTNNGGYSATDFCSYGESVIIEKIHVR